MVKFTFVSVFLVLTTMSALVFAAPTILPKYSIRVRFTEYFLFSNGLEKPGDRVTLVPGYNPSTTVGASVIITCMTANRSGWQVVSITDLKPLGTFDAEVIGKAGLFVSVREVSKFTLFDRSLLILCLNRITSSGRERRTFGNLGTLPHSLITSKPSSYRCLQGISNNVWCIELPKLRNLCTGLKVTRMYVHIIYINGKKCSQHFTQIDVHAGSGDVFTIAHV